MNYTTIWRAEQPCVQSLPWHAAHRAAPHQEHPDIIVRNVEWQPPKLHAWEQHAHGPHAAHLILPRPHVMPRRPHHARVHRPAHPRAIRARAHVMTLHSVARLHTRALESGVLKGHGIARLEVDLICWRTPKCKWFRLAAVHDNTQQRSSRRNRQVPWPNVTYSNVMVSLGSARSSMCINVL